MERYSLTSAGRFNIAHQQRAWIRVSTRDVEREARWGLLAPWRGHGGKRGPMVFAADEATIAATPMLRNARAKRRCLVLADGWFAWRAIDNADRGTRNTARSRDSRSSKKRQPYWIHAPGPIAFAGLVATHADDGVESFAIVMVPASGIVLDAVARVARPFAAPSAAPFAAPNAAMMPAIVDESWLASPELVTPSLDGWRVDAVSSHVDDPAHDDAACVVPLGNPAQGELF
jgi:hypothetical protein